MQDKNNSYGRLKLACYITNVSMSVVANLAPILFLGFHDLYNISYALLGLLVLVNFSTQLIVDLIFSFFSHKFNFSLSLKLTPVLTVIGLTVFALAPVIFPSAPYVGLVIGTVIYAASGGLGEVLISPIIAAIPADDPDREVSKLHSIYAWGVVFVVPLVSFFILFFTINMWQLLVFICSLIPLTASLLFIGTRLPELNTPERVSGVIEHLKNPTLILCIVAIFLGGASECTMSQWASSYIEGALGVDKIYGDIFGVTLFAAMLGLGRTLYSKLGRSPERILLFGSIGAVICYLVAALSKNSIVGLIACALTGLAVSMLWPGTLIAASDRIPTGGVFVYAVMAAGGDLGASLGPQMVGAIADTLSLNTDLASSLSMTPDELGLRAGILIGALFPAIAIIFYAILLKSKKPKIENISLQ